MAFDLGALGREGRSAWRRLKRVASYVVRGPDAELQDYARSAPSAQNALDIFKGDWLSALPVPLTGLNAGSLPLFADERLRWGIQALGGVDGLRVLELGPLEGAHTWMLEQAGASSVVAIEANRRAYLKCLVVKELLGLQRARFLCGDFVEYLRDTSESFDLCLASGVLYHLADPAGLVARVARVAPRLFIWTQYYDQDAIARNPRVARRFTASAPASSEGFVHTLYRFEYRRSRVFTSFCGGPASSSCWMTRDDILACCRHFGYDTMTVGCEEPAHPNGPSLALVARRVDA
jgi:hypothetical protein